MRTTRPLVAMAVAALAALALLVAAGCGSDDAEDAGEAVESVATVATGASPEDGTTTAPSGGAAEVLEIPAAETGLAFAVEEASAPAGPVTLRMPNPSTIPHSIAVDEPERQVGEVVPQGGVSEITVDFPAGEYQYYCSVPGHREAGMVGVLTVK